ncbi:hypothetical protein ES288_D08G282900v1 [Gossypium darwinii]|uniref:DUF1308 domain-containing protein n=1 Tax=Gossypium darwinii TaxID=34276 RepID=A0A5D2BS08_GOSDA|nr:hypothetical protein ES288_D08G282900v1 [Gossypium darwinii]
MPRVDRKNRLFGRRHHQIKLQAHTLEVGPFRVLVPLPLSHSSSFFSTSQAMSELQYPIHVNLSAAVSGKRGIICQSVLSEFKELVLMCGGANEKHRADQLLKCLLVVRDSPSERLIGLPTTRKLALKNKIVFGTGDYWRAPTLTANMAFVRAVAQTGMSLFTIEHSPRALTGN